MTYIMIAKIVQNINSLGAARVFASSDVITSNN